MRHKCQWLELTYANVTENSWGNFQIARSNFNNYVTAQVQVS